MSCFLNQGGLSIDTFTSWANTTALAFVRIADIIGAFSSESRLPFPESYMQFETLPRLFALPLSLFLEKPIRDADQFLHVGDAGVE